MTPPTARSFKMASRLSAMGMAALPLPKTYTFCPGRREYVLSRICSSLSPSTTDLLISLFGRTACTALSKIFLAVFRRSFLSMLLTKGYPVLQTVRYCYPFQPRPSNGRKYPAGCKSPGSMKESVCSAAVPCTVPMPSTGSPGKDGLPAPRRNGHR